MIINIEKKDHLTLLSIWEDSVKATHDFLSADELLKLKPIILNDYFNSIQLTGYKNTQDEILGFSGVLNKKIEMLFIASKSQGQGVGSQLCSYAIKTQKIQTVDVNEQNPRAILFYKKQGFEIFDRSELDGQGNPFPLLHLRLTASL